MKSLTPRKVLITRSREGNAELAPRLEAMGLEVMTLDLLSFLPPESWAEVDSRLTSLRRFDWLVFTSSTGVRFFVERMRSLGLALPEGAPPKVGAVGAGTAGELSKVGIKVDFMPQRYVTSALAEQLPVPPGKVLLLRADIAEKAMVSTLLRRRFSVEDIAIYRTQAAGPESVSKAMDAGIIVFGSPSAVEALCSRLSPELLVRLAARTAACIGPVTASAARRYGFKVVIEPPSNTFDSLLKVIGREIGVA